MGQRPPRVRRKLAVGIIERTQAELISARAEEPGGKPPHRRKDGTISARAEEVTASKLHSRSAKVDLRASGGTLVMAALSAGAAGRSPRARRNREKPPALAGGQGAISARAEEHHLSAAAPGCGRVRLALSDGLGAQLAAEPAVAESDMSAWARGNMRFVSDHHRLVSCGVRS